MSNRIKQVESESPSDRLKFLVSQWNDLEGHRATESCIRVMESMWAEMHQIVREHNLESGPVKIYTFSDGRIS